MKEKVILDPHFRRIANILAENDLDRPQSVCDLIWAKGEPMPEDRIREIRSDVIAIITGRWRYGDVGHFPKLRAILEVGGGFPSPQSLDYAACFSRRVSSMSWPCPAPPTGHCWTGKS